MSRPDSLTGPSGREAYGPVSDPSFGAAAGTLKVVAERISPDEVRAAEVAEEARIARLREHRATEHRATEHRATEQRATEQRAMLSTVAAAAPAPSDLVRGSFAPGSLVPGAGGPATAGLGVPAAPPGTVAPPTGALAPVAAPGLPARPGPPRRTGLAELLALVTGRRRTGRHRPDCVNHQGWSMFSPQRRPRRRRRFGVRV